MTCRMTIVLFFCCCSVWAAPKEMSVQVEEAQIRSAPNFFSGKAGNLAYGDRVGL